MLKLITLTHLEKWILWRGLEFVFILSWEETERENETEKGEVIEIKDKECVCVCVYVCVYMMYPSLILSARMKKDQTNAKNGK